MSGERKPPTGTVREELDRRLVTVARSILEHEGLEALTLRAAARAAGVSHMAPYRHFENKDELLAAVAEDGFHALTQALEGASRGRRSDTRSEFETLGLTYVTFAISNPALYRLMFGANLANRSRFPGLVAAGDAALRCCTAAVEPEKLGDGSANCASRKSIAVWAFIHGLACLVIDELIHLPPKGDRALNGEILNLLRSGNWFA